MVAPPVTDSSKVSVPATNITTQADMEHFVTAYPPCFTPIQSLVKITCDGLVLEKHHTGTVLVVRLLCAPIRGVPVLTSGEDENGDIRRIQLYSQSMFEHPTICFPQGRIIAIKEPLYKTSADGPECIRVDHPSNIMILNQTADIVPLAFRSKDDLSFMTTMDWKILGNARFIAKDYYGAINSYSQGILAIKAVNDEALRPVLLRNRAQVFLNLGFYDDAKQDALTANKEERHTKALYRAAKACYSLGQLGQCEQHLQELLKMDPSEPTAKEELDRVQARLREQQTGTYNFAAIVESVLTDRKVDCANFVKRVTVKDSPNRGRGLFTTEAVKAGDMLLVEKAYCTVTQEDDDHQCNTRDPLPGAEPVILGELVQKAYRNPSLADGLLDLYAGPDDQGRKKLDLVDGRPVFDTFRLANIITYNCFGFVHEGRVQTKGNQKSKLKTHKVSGVWITASYTNHSCSFNAMRAFIGDMMVIRATRDLQAGEEITFSYIGNDDPFSTRRMKMKNTWGFECNCALCESEMQATLSLAIKREEIMAKITPITIQSPDEVTDELITHLKSLADQLESLYEPSVFPRVTLAIVFVDLSTLLSTRIDAEGMAKYSRKALEYLGFDISLGEDGFAVDFSKSITKTCCIMACLHFASTIPDGRPMVQMMRLAKHFYKIVYGEDNTFASKFDDIVPSEVMKLIKEG